MKLTMLSTAIMRKPLQNVCGQPGVLKKKLGKQELCTKQRPGRHLLTIQESQALVSEGIPTGSNRSSTKQHCVYDR